ncbi:MAG TPA: hypothetical protein VHV77_13085 [Pirellulales bacterium]|jgi:hypothetical protein|nr:hypothetical protein [Pirellulales bacterium]
MTFVFPGLLILVIVFVLAFRLAGGLWSNLIMLGNVIVAALVATNYFELVAGFLANNLSMLAYYADFLAIWVLFAVTLMVLKAVTDMASPVKVRFPKPVETIGNFAVLIAIGWLFVCFATMTIHLAPLGRDAFAGGFKPENANFFGFAPDRLWMGLVQRESEGTFATSNVFDAKGDFMVRYAARREKFDRVEADPTQLALVQPAAFPTAPAQSAPPPFESQPVP